MEPAAVDLLEQEAERMKEELLQYFSGKPPERIEHLFSEASFFFQEEILGEWRKQGRYEELVDYILYQHEEAGGEELWQQVLLDLRLRNNEALAHKLLNGLYPARAEKFWVSLKNYKENPENHFSAAACAKAKGEAMKVLYEHAFLLENKPKAAQSQELINLVRSRITEINDEHQST